MGSAPGQAPSFGGLTEAPGGQASPEGAAMLFSRYAHAAEQAEGRRVLEVGCGPGLGLGLLASRASFAVGGDYDEGLLRVARTTYGPGTPLVRLDAQALPFRDGSFDVALFYEGSYYVPDMERAFDELGRVLSADATLLFVNANPERLDFIRSPLSVHYHTAQEFQSALAARGFEVAVRGAFPVSEAGAVARLASLARRVAERLGLIPRTLAGRALLKRLLVRRMVPIPDRIPVDVAAPAPLDEIPAGQQATRWKVIYVTARRGVVASTSPGAAAPRR